MLINKYTRPLIFALGAATAVSGCASEGGDMPDSDIPGSEAPGSDNTPESTDAAFTGDRADVENRIKRLVTDYLTADQTALSNGVQDFLFDKVDVDNEGLAHARVQQLVNGVPVLGGEAIVHLHQDGSFYRMSDSFKRFVSVDSTPKLTPAEAIEIAIELFGSDVALTEDPEANLFAMRHEGSDHLAYEVKLTKLNRDGEDTMPIYFIDAHTGEELLNYDNLQFIALENSDAVTYDMNNGTNYSSAGVADDSDEIANEAHVNIMDTLDYFADNFNRDSYDNRGKVVKSYVHYSNNYVNAYWDGQRLTYGDGDGRYARALTVLDVVAHEFSHAITTNEANLRYRGESGALNEATSDIFAAAVEAHVDSGASLEDIYWVGEDCWLAGEALRFMNDPTRDGQSKDHYSTRYTGSQDNGGVHLNSGIANLFFYLVSEGGTHPNSSKAQSQIDGIGIDKAVRVWYKALTSYMTSSTSFAGAREATKNACDSLNLSADDCYQVELAWYEVGVGSKPADPNGGGDNGGGGGDSSCSGKLYSGNVSDGGQAYEPADGEQYRGYMYLQSDNGTSASLTSDNDNLEVSLYRWSWFRWAKVESSANSVNDDRDGYYAFVINSLGGSGSYELCIQ